MESATHHYLSRRRFLQQTAALAATLPLIGPLAIAAEKASTIDLGSRLELFVDDFLIERLAGKAQLRLHHPEPREIALTHDAPWEGSGSGYHSVFKDGGIYRMYYKAWHLDVSPGKLKTDAHPLFCCYAESDDGIRWRKPALGLHEFNGSKANNIVMVSGKLGTLNVDAGHPAVFKDENPAAPADARYKAFFRSKDPNGLLPFKSHDGLHWAPMSTEPLLVKLGAFDSQNLAFWDPALKEYRAYWRIFTGIGGGKSVRGIRTATSKDFLNWGKPVDLTYADSPPEELYVNQVKPYPRAPHLLLGFPVRYVDRGWSGSMRALPEPEHREKRSSANPRFGTAITESLLMASRDGVRFKRWNEAFLRPGIERDGTWNYGHQYIAWHLVETKPALEGAPDELSLYETESYWTGNSSALRRYTLRVDGFVSVHAPMSGGELVTRPLTFTGSKLLLNFSSSAAGEVLVEMQDAAGQPVPGFALGECEPLFGDSLQRAVTWKNGADLRTLGGKPVRLRFAIKDADLYSLRFAE
ncbi:MAG: twin-arginine translocation signal domain-containing protein [Verrucomicrobiota bacterium]|nr:twin-arginine translocation signal domain-containing protein [Verrucomicrobiota bacterium]